MESNVKLVRTSSYRIAEKNRVAKYDFLNQNLVGNYKFQRGSNLRRSMPISDRRFGEKPITPIGTRRNPILNKQDSVDETNTSEHMINIVNAIEKLNDLEKNDQGATEVNENIEIRRVPFGLSYPRYSSVPGTPVSSRHVLMLAQDQGEETFDELKKTSDDGTDQLQEFIKSMEKLRSEKVDQKISNETNAEVKISTFGYNKIDYNAPSILKRFPSRQEATKTNIQQDNDDGIFKRKYSGQISLHQFNKDENIDSNNREINFIKAKYYTRTSYPLSIKELQSTEISKERSISNREKFNEILNKFKNMK